MGPQIPVEQNLPGHHLHRPEDGTARTTQRLFPSAGEKFPQKYISASKLLSRAAFQY